MTQANSDRSPLAPIPTIFESCRPRPDVLAGTVSDADFAADLAQVVARKGTDDYVDPNRFFANTYPTRGLKNLLTNVCRRLSGAGGEAAAIFRLDTSYGGGKTHGLIALCHAARHGAELPEIGELVDPALLPRGRVRIAAFDGENADPDNGRRMKGGHLAYTPWGEIASDLAGPEGYERVRRSDESRVAPGAGTLRELFGGEPVLILLDELSVYLRKAARSGQGADQLTAFLTSLFKAVEGAPNAALVYTLAIGKDGRAIDAYRNENQLLDDGMAEAQSVSARMATLLNPTEEDETIKVLRRRLFEDIDEEAASVAADAYRKQWSAHANDLPVAASRPEAEAVFRSSYPLHPEVLDTLKSKTATLGNFQRVRGMLRLLARTVGHLWKERPADAMAIHLHHIDPGHGPIRQEIVTRLEQSAFVPAISRDVSGGPGDKALAQEIDARDYRGLQPWASRVARTIFMHTLAFNEPLKGVSLERLRYAVLAPGADIDFIDDARRKFMEESAYLDDRPGVPMRFLAEANLRQIIRRMEDHIDAGDVRAELNDRIRGIFGGGTLEMVQFPGGPFDVADDVADGRPKLVVPGYEAVNVGASVESVPELIQRIHEKKGSEGSALRKLRNNLVFVAADEARIEDMHRRARRRLALREMKRPDRLTELAAHQQDDVREMEARSEQVLALAIQQCYRHVFYPSGNRLGGSAVDLAHTAIDTQSASDRPGAGQQQVVRALRDLNKLRMPDDQPDAPTYVRDRTPLKKKGWISMSSLRNEFRRDPALPILVGDGAFIRGVRQGIDQGVYVYQSGDLVCGPGDAWAGIRIDEQSLIFTMAHAKVTGIWPRKVVEPPDNPDPNGEPEPPDPRPVPETDSFVAEGYLREALPKLWEQVRKAKVEALAELTIRVFEADEGFRLFGGIGAESGAKRTVTIYGGYRTRDGGECELKFEGPVSDAQPVREFLDLQLRDAASKDMKVGFELIFESGLSMGGDAAEKLTGRITRYAGSGVSAEVTAKARA